MKPLNDIMVEIGHWAGFLVLLINGLSFLLLRFNLIAAPVVDFFGNGLGREVLTLWGIISLGLSIYFVRNIVIMHRARGRIMSAAPRGPIWISPTAVRDFVLKTLEDQIHLQNARIGLHTEGEGIVVTVRASVPLTEPLTQLGERIQESVKSSLESRIGISVQSVEVYVRSITTTSSAAPSGQDEEYTALEFPERERHE